MLVKWIFGRLGGNDGIKGAEYSGREYYAVEGGDWGVLCNGWEVRAKAVYREVSACLLVFVGAG